MSKQRPLAWWLNAGRAPAVLAAIALAWSAPAQSQVSVSSGGTPSFSQAIDVPPGVAGMSPKLGIFYAGGGVNGPLGHGWSIQGISHITRCAATKATDGIRRAVAYRRTDKLCLDGQRLVPTDATGSTTGVSQSDDAGGGLLGTNVREFRTEKDSYSRIRAYGYATGTADGGASGPQYFKVWTKSGLIYEYGDGPSKDANTNALINAQKTVGTSTTTVPIAWAVARISDTLGNAIDFKYEQRFYLWGSGTVAGSPTPGREWNLLEVQYGRNKVVFNYDLADARTDKSEAYHLGYKNVSARLLNSVTTYVNTTGTALGAGSATPVKTTKLTYSQGALSNRKRISAIATCAGDVGSTICMPATTFTYADGGNDAYTVNTSFAGSPLATTQLYAPSTTSGPGTMGIVLGDFNGDGRTDILKWADDPLQNQMFFSNGDGTFTEFSSFNLQNAGQNLFKSDDCYYSIITDLNGDGLPDIFRFASSNSITCPGAGPTRLYLNQGGGVFQETTYTGPVLTRQVSTIQRVLNPNPQDKRVIDGYSEGRNFYVMDVDGDGIPDIVTTVLPRLSYTDPVPEDQPCSATVICNHVYYGNGTGSFTEATSPPLVSASSLYIRPDYKSLVTLKNLADLNGDGLTDLFGVSKDASSTPIFLSNGDGTFTGQPLGSINTSCSMAIDFNGDGRSDCLHPSNDPAIPSVLLVADGSGQMSAVTGFDVIGAGNELAGVDPMSLVLSGVLIADINGDGRQDILRWKTNQTGNAVYLSNGDGSFTPSGTFNLNSAATPLEATAAWTTQIVGDIVLGDFTGKGNTEILRIKTDADGTNIQNALYVKTDSTPLDQLIRVTSSSGLNTDLNYMPISSSDAGNTGRYVSDRGTPNAATGPMVDVTFPMYVVTTLTSDSGVGTSRVSTEYSYLGLKADTQGRGILGFREVRRQSPGANGDNLTVRTSYLQKHPYIGVASRSETRVATLNDTTAPARSVTVNTYCDTSATAVVPSETAPCSVSAGIRIQRPYLYQSTETGTDLSGYVLPQVVTQNIFNNSGDPTKITVTTSGTSAGIAQTASKVVDNLYDTDATSGDDWVLGRLLRSTVTNTVQDLRPSLTASAGNGAFASATVGTGSTNSPPALTLTGCTNSGATTSPTPATYTCTLGNTGQTAATSITYSSTVGSVVTWPPSCAATTTNCGTVVVSSSTAAGTYNGSLTATPNTGTGTTTAQFSLTVNQGVAPTCTVSASPTALSAPGQVTLTANCSPAATNGYTWSGGYTGSSATPSVTVPVNATANYWVQGWNSVGGSAGVYVTVTVVSAPTPPALTLTDCTNSGATTSPTPATYTCTLGNTGQTAATSITYSSTVGSVVTWPPSCAATTTNCGTVVVSSSTAAGTYNGSLTATPNTGTGTTTAQFSLTVNQGVAPTCTVSASPTALSAPGQVTLTANCSPAATNGYTWSGGYTGSSATPSVTVPANATANYWVQGWNSVGGSAGVYVTVTVVPTPPALTLTGCTNSGATTSPTPATYTCTLGNTGQTAATSITYSSTVGSVVTWPPSCAATTTNCGTVVVSSSIVAGTYSGSLTASPNAGTGATTAAFTLTVNVLPPTLVVTWNPTPLTANQGFTVSWASTNATAVSVNCTSAGTGYVSNATLPSSGASTGVASTAWVGYPSTCLWTATGASGSATVTQTLTTLPTPPALTLTGCTNSGATNSPTPATYSCTLGNTGQTAATSISYSSTVGSVVTWPPSCAATTTNCGTVVVSSSTAVGTYSGSLTATPNTGTGTTTAQFSLTVNQGVAPTCTVSASPTVLGATGGQVTLTANCSPAATNGYTWSDGATGSSTTPTITVHAYYSDIYTVQGWNSVGGSAAASVYVTVLEHF